MGLLKHSDLIELEDKISNYLDVGNLKRILQDVVVNNGAGVYLDDQVIHEKLSEYTKDIKYGLSMADVERICLVASLPIFKKMVSYQKQYVTQAEFCTFVNSAVEETGLMKYVAYGIVCAICYSLNWTEEINSLAANDIGNLHNTVKGIGIPYSAYDMKALEAAASSDNNKESYIEIVKYYAQLGIPKGKYLLAKTMAYTDEEAEGFQMMLSAANDGDAEACLYLGNYYYEKGEASWDKAYKYYTGYGRAILREKERDNLINILNKRQYNKWMMVANWIFVVLTLIALICIPPFSVYRGQLVFGIIAIALETAIAAYGVCVLKQESLYDMTFETVVCFIIWMIFMMLRIGL